MFTRRKKNKLIDDLFALRCELALNFDENEETIFQIDEQLAELGVEYITHSELLHALGCDTLPAADVIISDEEAIHTQWTSRRLVTTYQGQHYELQIIEGVPLKKESNLRRSALDVPVTEQQIAAGETEIIKNVGMLALGATPIPEIVDAVTLLDTIFTIGGIAVSNMSPSTIIEGVEGVALLTLSTHMKIVLVKPYQSADRNQKWMYIGTYVSYEVSHTWEVDSPIGEHGSIGKHAHINYKGACSSVSFYDYSLATQNYRCYKANEDFVVDYSILYITLRIFQHESRYDVPRSIASILIPQD